ncbi:IclR family transcriptional regulator [Evansella clarkii]|uniref:IclR family transcriptional regulator n=1 Tax=Evansella clarkii TaxID=79879 RepID=UPI000997E333|nr:IclR family transcriptional regulator [Evansella clarkii]
MVQSVDRAMIILDCLKESPKGLGVTDLSKKLGVAKSTVHRLLSTLEKHRYVKKVNNEGIYQLGLKFLEMNHAVMENMNIVELAHPILDELTKTVAEITHLVMLENFELVYIDKVESTSTIRIYSQTGRRAPMHCTGVGKAMAAYFPEKKLERFFSHTDWKAFTPYTITKEEDFRAELDRIREKGYSLDDEEHEEGIRCVAAPVFNHQGEVQYAISATGPTNRMNNKRIEEIIPLVKKAAYKISKAIGY